MYYVYVLRNHNNFNRYIGHCKNIPDRLNDHNFGKVKSTKAFIPWHLVHHEEFNTRVEAITRERFLKSGIGREWLDYQTF